LTYTSTCPHCGGMFVRLEEEIDPAESFVVHRALSIPSTRAIYATCLNGHKWSVRSVEAKVNQERRYELGDQVAA
jgi:hypothetical protein